MKVNKAMALIAAALVSACGGGQSSGADQLSMLTDIPQGAVCIHGGVRTDKGGDTNYDGRLDQSEVTDSHITCHKVQAMLAKFSVELAGSHCAQGGQKVERGMDTNSNGVLADDEIDQVSYVCGDITSPSLSLAAAALSHANGVVSFIFTTDEAGFLSYSGACEADVVSVFQGLNSVLFQPLGQGYYDDCAISITDSVGNVSEPLTLPSFVIGRELNDTGTVLCGDHAYTEAGSYPLTGSMNHNNDLVCSVQPTAATPSADGYDGHGDTIRAGQDALYGRDVSFLDDSDGYKGFSFTKVSNHGDALPSVAGLWYCLKDEVTGLMWEVKSQASGVKGDGGLHDADDTLTWYDNDNTQNGGLVGAMDNYGNTCHGYNSGNIKTFCNTQAYVARVNEAALCGYSDWRLPSRHELLSIVSGHRISPAADVDYFTDLVTVGSTLSAIFWSASPSASIPSEAWSVNFITAGVSTVNKSSGLAARLVRDAN